VDAVSDEEMLANLSDAIAVMTAWCEPDGGVLVHQILDDIVDGDVVRLTNLLSGMISLSGSMLSRSAEVEGIAHQEVLRQVAANALGVHDDR
jgi:hypothetical protein